MHGSHERDCGTVKEDHLCAVTWMIVCVYQFGVSIVNGVAVSKGMDLTCAQPGIDPGD